MKPYKYILLDLDGTIIDSKEGVTKSVEYALNYFDIEVTDLNTLCKFIGPPLKDSFTEFYHFNADQTTMALAKYRERYSEVGVFENRLYDGIREFIKKANENGLQLFLATSKPLVFAKQIISYFDLDKEFVFIGGSELDDSRRTKTDVIKYVLEKNNINDLSKVVMVGDRKYDIIGAKEANIDSIGVLYGYGSREELSNAGANYIVQNLDELANIFDIN